MIRKLQIFFGLKCQELYGFLKDTWQIVTPIVLSIIFTYIQISYLKKNYPDRGNPNDLILIFLVVNAGAIYGTAWFIYIIKVLIEIITIKKIVLFPVVCFKGSIKLVVENWPTLAFIAIFYIIGFLEVLFVPKCSHPDFGLVAKLFFSAIWGLMSAFVLLSLFLLGAAIYAICRDNWAKTLKIYEKEQNGLPRDEAAG